MKKFLPAGLQQKMIALIGMVFFFNSAFSQGVGIGTSTPHASAQLDISSSNKGTLITTMTSAQRKAIADPATGLLVYDINKKTIYMFDGISWLPFLFSNADKNPAQLISPVNVSSGDFFAYKVSISNDYAIVGAYNKLVGVLGGGFENRGAAYIFFRNNGVWQQQASLLASDGAADDYFGASVAISGSYALVGAWGDDVGADANQGSAYVFNREGSSWTQMAKLTAADGAADDYFGHSAAISGNTIIVGAYGDNIGANINQGSAYIYTLSGSSWTFRAKLTASDGGVDDRFGNSVSVSGSYVIAGAYLDDIGANADQGSVYSFYELTNAAGWTTAQAYHQKILAADGEADDYFGVSVSAWGSGLAVGASGDDIGANTSQGSAYLFYRSPIGVQNWTLPEKITANDGVANDNFGICVSRTQLFTVVGAYRSDAGVGLLNSGAVYVYNSSGSAVTFKTKIDDDTAETNGYFGFTTGVSGYEIIIGAYGKNNDRGQIGFKNIE
ncbi:MAG: FG-GAP repeat protein [Rhizobacter sp.]|nr:FG-GAP repeat protein [Ferruginibacter sp.]